MSIVKVHLCGVRTYPVGDRRLVLEAPGKPTLEVAAPPDVRNGVRGVWTPEELLLGSLATCFELTVRAIAERRDVRIHALRTDATGHVQSKNGRFRLMLIELDVTLETDPGCEHEVEAIARVAKDRCLIGSALDVPTHLTVDAHAALGELAMA